MYTEEEKFRQKEATVIKSTKKSKGKGRIEVMNIKVRIRVNFISVSQDNFLSYKRSVKLSREVDLSRVPETI